jgi:hypothetical protein
VGEDDVDARDVGEATDHVEERFAAVGNDLELELVQVATNRAGAERRLRLRDQRRREHLEEAQELSPDFFALLAPGPIVPRSDRVEEDRVPLDLLHLEGDLDLPQDRLDQVRDDLLAMD